MFIKAARELTADPEYQRWLQCLGTGIYSEGVINACKLLYYGNAVGSDGS